MPKFQSYGRAPHPLRMAGSYVVVGVLKFAKFALPAPQMSPPVAELFTAVIGMTPLTRQSTTKLVLRSVHVLPPVAAVPLGLLLVWKLASGLVRPPVIELPSAAARYLPKLNFSAVLPVPNTSYTTAPLGVRSL